MISYLTKFWNRKKAAFQINNSSLSPSQKFFPFFHKNRCIHMTLNKGKQKTVTGGQYTCHRKGQVVTNVSPTYGFSLCCC